VIHSPPPSHTVTNRSCEQRVVPHTRGDTRCITFGMSVASSGVHLGERFEHRRLAFCVSCVIALAISACFHPFYDRPACATDDACPEGLICVEHMLCGNCDPNAPGDRCGPSGTCESNAYCSIPDATCPSGRRYNNAGGLSGQCVGDQLPPDARPDAPPPDARVCFGNSPFTVCFTTPPTGTIDVSIPTTFNTDTGTVIGTGTQLTCATPTSGGGPGGNGYCVLAANTITINQSLRAIGTKPLVLVAVDSISVPMSIDVSSHRMGPIDSLGAGADPATGCGNGTPPSSAMGTSGGGAGGSSMGPGGSGGNGGGVNGGVGGVHAGSPGFGTVLRGGCPGQDGAGVGHGARGHGGGAVFLIAGNSITVGGMINAGGEGGAGATGANDGGGGAGAGGLIGFDAMTITGTGTLIANGGGGGEGGSSGGTKGNPGDDASSTSAAAGGTGGSNSGGDGGAGSAGAAGGTGVIGQDGTAGGGGGGGGAGLIKAPATATLGTNVSPAPTP
jgi:hypothetical protein